MNDFIDRLEAEQKELQERLAKLQAFYASVTFAEKITLHERNLMLEQGQLMIQLNAILLARLRLHKKPTTKGT